MITVLIGGGKVLRKISPDSRKIVTRGGIAQTAGVNSRPGSGVRRGGFVDIG